MRRLGWVGLALALVSSLVTVGPARAATGHVTSVAFTFLPPTVSIEPGDSLDYVNVDVAPHNVTALGVSRTGSPVFRSETVSAGGTAAVKGVEKLAPGVYDYTCTIHPNMLGTLQVNDPAPSAAGGPGPMTPPIPVGIVPTPTSIATDGTHLFVASHDTGTIRRMDILPGGLLGPALEHVTGVEGPLGVLVGVDQTLYVSDSHIPAGSDRPVGRVWALPPTGGAAAAVGRVVIDNLPNGRHNTNGMAIHRGRLYIANGNATDDGVTGGFPELPLNGTLLSVPVGARGLDASKSPQALQVEARGMRNVYDVAFRPGTDEAWLPTNGPDAMDPYGEDLLHMVDVRGPAADMGFPGCVYAASPEGPKFMQNAAVAKTSPCNPRHRRPEQLLGLHVSADGLAFGPEDAAWGGDLYIAEFGNLYGTAVTGHKIVRVPMTGAKAGAPVDVGPGAGPLDVVFGPEGTGLYVADYASQQISLIRAIG